MQAMQTPEDLSSSLADDAKAPAAKRLREAALLLCLAVLYGVFGELAPAWLLPILRAGAIAVVLACVFVWMPLEVRRMRRARAVRLQALKDTLAHFEAPGQPR